MNWAALTPVAASLYQQATDYLLARAEERSTWLGVFGLVSAVTGLAFPEASTLATVLAAVFASAVAGTPDGKHPFAAKSDTAP